MGVYDSMLNKKALEVVVGLFVLAGLGALLMLAIVVSGLSELSIHERGYAITADFNNVGGLKPKAKVTVAGVPVGRVKSISLDQEHFVARVHIMIHEPWTAIPSDSQASILTAGLLGDNYIGLTPGFSDTFLAENSHIALEDTNSAIILEQLISKFVSGQASANKPPASGS